MEEKWGEEQVYESRGLYLSSHLIAHWLFAFTHGAFAAPLFLLRVRVTCF